MIDSDCKLKINYNKIQKLYFKKLLNLRNELNYKFQRLPSQMQLFELLSQACLNLLLQGADWFN